MPRIPNDWSPLTWMNSANSAGARKVAARPVVA